MKQRLYIDTKVFDGYFDEVFSEACGPLLVRLQKGEFILLFSAITQHELSSAPEGSKIFVNSLKAENKEYLETNIEAFELAKKYIEEGVVSKSSLADCLHIALATINCADCLISLNLETIVNDHKIPAYNAINIRNGYKELVICSPWEFRVIEDKSYEKF